MRNYEKPIVTLNEEIAEGVYAASGDCWSISTVMQQDWTGTHRIFKIICQHSTGVEHISTASTVVLTFNHPLTSAYPENSAFSSSFSGNTMTITRTLLADAYQSGDDMTYQVWVAAADETTTRSLAITSATITCTKSVNVQGGGTDEL